MVEVVLETVGSIAFAACGIPAAWDAIKTKKVGMPWMFMILWSIGEVCMLVWSAMTGHYSMLCFNYGPNFVCLAICLYHKIKEPAAH